MGVGPARGWWVNGRSVRGGLGWGRGEERVLGWGCWEGWRGWRGWRKMGGAWGGYLRGMVVGVGGLEVRGSRFRGSGVWDFHRGVEGELREGKMSITVEIE